MTGFNWWSHLAKSGFPQWMTGSLIRCHLIGIAVCVALLAAIHWSWSQTRHVVKQVEYGDTKIDIHDAMKLVEDADLWRRRFAEATTQRDRVNQRAGNIAQWLPTMIDWTTTTQEISQLAESVDLQLLAIESGDRHVGTRVGVATATCQVEGSYGSVCRFLDRLASHRHPIWCDAIDLSRAEFDQQDNRACAVTLSLRLPYAASGSIASRLLNEEKPTDAG